MATGPAGSRNSAIGLRYREVLKRSGIDLTLVSTAGGFANVEQLKDPASGVSVALVESGVTNHVESRDLVSLGGLALEPVWLFLRGETRGPLAERVAGKRISIEPEGSGTRVLFRKLLELNGIPDASLDLRALSPDEGANALVGQVDRVFMRRHGRHPRRAPASGRQGRARRFRALTRMWRLNFSKVVPTAGDLPQRRHGRASSPANLVVRADLHPALRKPRGSHEIRRP
jgi:hypothetical protein